MTRSNKLLAGAIIASLLAALSACNRADESKTAGQKVDAAIAKTEQKVDAAKAEIGREAEQAKQSTSQAAQQVAMAVGDTAITAAVMAKLAADKQLKATDIDVQTQAGHVALRGKAPDQAAVDRASQLAGTVQGVSAVDNQLTVRR